MYIKSVKNMQSNVRFSKYVAMLIFFKEVVAFNYN